MYIGGVEGKLTEPNQLTANNGKMRHCTQRVAMRAWAHTINWSCWYMMITSPVQSFDILLEIISSMDIFVSCELVENIVRDTMMNGIVVKFVFAL